MINLSIDGKQIEVTEGTTVLNAARSAGVKIPTLCDDPHLSPYGGCRLCLVEVEGARTLQPSCTLPVTNNMVVRTDTEKTKAARKFILTLIFSERNHFCPYCQVSGGDCELQNAAYAEGMTHWPLSPNYTPFPMDASHPYLILENNRCILCRRCVRACGELVGNFTLGFEERGAKSLLVCDIGVPMGVSSCISCGMCAQVCPTGAIIDRWSAYKGRETQVEKTKTVCTGCSVGCSIEVLTRDNNLVRIESDWDGAVNSGLTCKLGRFIPMDDQRERITTPMLKKNGALKAATWDEAFDAITAKLKPFAGKKESPISAIASSKLSAESLHHFKQLFADQLKASLVTSTEEGRHTHTASAVAKKLGKSFEGKLELIKNADCVVSFGADLVKKHEVAGFFVKRQIPSGSPLIVVDPNPNELTHWAALTIKPAKGITAELIAQFKTAAAELDSKKEPTGEIAEAAKLIKNAKKPVFVYSGLIDEKTLTSLVDFAGSIGATLISMKGGSNSLAAAQLGLDVPVKVDESKLAYLALADEDPSEKMVKALKDIPFLVIQATYHSKLTAQADVVLPTNHWFEEDGHYVNLEGKVQASHKSLKVLEVNRSNDEVLVGLSEKLGMKLDSNWKKAISQPISPVTIEA